MGNKTNVLKIKFIWHKGSNYLSLKPITQVYGVCFDDGGNILIIRTPNENWNIPGGTPEDDETPEQALKRELKEEADVTINKNAMIGYYEVISSEPKIYQLRFASLIKEKKPQTLDPALGVVNERKFVPPDEFLKYVKIKDYRPMLNEAISWFKKNKES